MRAPANRRFGDRGIVFAAGFLRAVANGLIGVVAGIYLAELGFEPATWGAILGAGVAGTAVASAVFCATRVGAAAGWLGTTGAATIGDVVFDVDAITLVHRRQYRDRQEP